MKVKRTKYGIDLIPFKSKGVYLLYKEVQGYQDKCIYVGQGVLYKRLSFHCKDKDWDYADIFAIEDDNKRRYVEAVLIESLSPKLNIIYPKTESIY